MRVVCAWCGVTITAGRDDIVSHGICGVCAAAEEARARRAIARERRGMVPACQLADRRPREVER